MSSRAGRSRRVAAGVSILSLCISGVLHAQQAPARDATELDTVIVTGTNIRGADPAGNAVQVISAEQIRDSGKATVGDFLRELPANFAGGVGMSDNAQGGQDGSVAGSNLTGGQGVNLRGLGALSTLVLVNGRRVAASGQFGDYVDVSAIPTNAVSHMEVLLDGASAVYGSDAVGGVVNIITKRSDDGAQTSVRLGTTTQGGGEQVQVGQTWGRLWDGGGLILGYEFNDQANVLASERDIYNGGDFSDRGGVNWRRANARAGSAANLFTGTAAANGTVSYRVPGGAGTGLTAASLIPVTDGVGNTYNAWDAVDILPEMRRHSAFFGFEHDIGDAVSLYGDLRYTHRRGTYNQGYQAVFGTLAPTHPDFIPGVANNYGVLIDDAPLQRAVGVDSLTAAFGAAFDLAGSWRATADLSHSRETQFRRSDVLRNANIYDRLPSPNGGSVQAPSAMACSQMGLTSTNLPANANAQQRYCAALGYEPFNPWTTDPLSAQVRAQMIGYEDLEYTSWLTQASLKADGALFDIPGGTIKLAAGLDWRREHIGGELDFNWRSTRDAHETFGDTERDVTAAFVELAIPLVGAQNANVLARKLDVSLAGRYERGRGLGDFSTFNPKAGFDWKPVDSLTVRGSWGTSFHAPPMRYAYNGVQPIAGGNGAFMRADLYNAPCDTTLIPLNGVSGTPGGAGNCSFTAVIVAGGAGPTLRPEESTTWTLGVDYAPQWAPGLKVGASYFNLKIDDRIVRIQSGTLGSILSQLFATGSTPYLDSLEINPGIARVEEMFADPRYLGQLGAGPVQSAADVAMIINATQINLASLRMDGVDFHLDYSWDTAAAGMFDLFARGTWLNSYDVQATPGGQYVDQLGKYSSGGNPVALRSQQGLRWSTGDLRATLTANYVDSYACEQGCYVPNAGGLPVLSSQPVRIGSWTTFDLAFDYDLSSLGGFFDAARVNFTALNVTDRDPPFVDGGTAANDALADPYDPANATVIGRTLVLSFNKRW